MSYATLKGGLPTFFKFKKFQEKMCMRPVVFFYGLVGFAFGEIANIFGSTDQTVSRVGFGSAVFLIPESSF